MSASPNWHPWLPCSDQPEESCADAGCPVHGTDWGSAPVACGDPDTEACTDPGCSLHSGGDEVTAS